MSPPAYQLSDGGPEGHIVVDPPGDGDCLWWVFLAYLRILRSWDVLTPLGVPADPASLRRIIRDREDSRRANSREGTSLDVFVFQALVFDAAPAAALPLLQGLCIVHRPLGRYGGHWQLHVPDLRSAGAAVQHTEPVRPRDSARTAAAVAVARRQMQRTEELHVEQGAFDFLDAAAPAPDEEPDAAELVLAFEAAQLSDAREAAEIAGDEREAAEIAEAIEASRFPADGCDGDEERDAVELVLAFEAAEVADAMEAAEVAAAMEAAEVAAAMEAAEVAAAMEAAEVADAMEAAEVADAVEAGLLQRSGRRPGRLAWGVA